MGHSQSSQAAAGYTNIQPQDDSSGSLASTVADKVTKKLTGRQKARGKKGDNDSEKKKTGF